MSVKPLLLCIVGPTASGKTALSLALRERWPVEILCMDSMQIYRGMDIGTAKPSKLEQALIPHHMLDLIPPEQGYSVAEYRAEAGQAIDRILRRGGLPLLVGGTGLYLRALSLPLDLGGTPRDEAVRAGLQQELETEGAAALHCRLSLLDPVAAARLHLNDSRRVIRALEVIQLTGQPFSAQKMPGPEDGPYRLLLYAVDWPRELLYQRIERRVDQMMADGLLEEIRGLLEAGLSPAAQSMQGLGYKELLPHIQGQASLEDCVELIKRRTRNYAKRQLTWFRKEPGIRWLPYELSPAQFLDIVKEDMEQHEHR